MRSGHRSAAVQNYEQPTPRILQGISDSLRPPRLQAFCTNPPAACLKCDTTEGIPTDCHTGFSHAAAAPTERKPSSLEGQCANFCSTPWNWHYLTREKWQGDADNIWFLTPPTDVSTSWIHVGSQVTGNTWNITSKFWPLMGYIWTTIG